MVASLRITSFRLYIFRKQISFAFSPSIACAYQIGTALCVPRDTVLKAGSFNVFVRS